LRDELNEQIRVASEGLSQVLGRCVVPIFRVDQNENQQAHGTGILVATSERTYLVSAAHVFDPMAAGEKLFIYVGRRERLFLSGELLRTLVPAGKSRLEDRVDIGVLEMDPSTSPPYAAINKTALPIDAVAPGATRRQGKQYLVTGFPASKSVPHHVSREITSVPFGNLCISAPTTVYDRLGLSEETNIVLQFDPKTTRGEKMRVVTSPSPAGLSGAPIWYVWDGASATNHHDRSVLVGVLIEYRAPHRVLVATDIKIALDMIARFEATALGARHGY
jgi:hypothetical protein